MYLRGVKTHLARTVSAARRLKTCTVIWSWPEISLAEPDNRQTTSCASPPLDSPPPPLIWPVFNYGPSHFDTSGRNTKQECIWAAWTVADPSDNLPSGLPTLRRRRERRKSILNRFVVFFFFFSVFTGSHGYQTVYQQTELGLGCLSRSCFHGNRWTDWAQSLRGDT